MEKQPVRFQRLCALLLWPRAHWVVIAVALLLMAPSLWAGLVLDDFVLALKARPRPPAAAGAGAVSDATHVAGLPPDPWFLFTFTTGDPAQNELLIDEGVLLPWWTEPGHLNAFFRPLSSLSHVLDFRLFPGLPALMHAHSLVWYALLLCALFGVYRSLEQGDALVAALAFVLFAWDDAHGATVGWIANRNALLAVALSLPALALQHRAVAHGARAGRWLGPLCFALGLAAGETAISVFGYLVGYALCLDPRSVGARLRSLAPYLALLLAHRGIYRALELGSFGSSGYHDPLREPLGFAASLAHNLPVLLSAQVFLPLADLGLLGDRAARLALWPISLFGVGLFLAAAWSFLRVDRLARFWALGCLLAAIPVSASVPGERLLLVLGVGACPVLARVILRLARAAPGRSLRRSLPLAATFAALHLGLGPLLLPLRAYAMAPLAAASARLDAGVPETADVTRKSVIVVNAPVTLMVSYLQPARAARGVPRPSQLYLLSSSSSTLRVTRAGARSLRLALEDGFLARPEETHYRADVSGLVPGNRVLLRGLTIEVLDTTPDGRPRTIRCDFSEPLESAHYLLRVYRDGRLVSWQPPALGQSEWFPPQEFFPLMAAELRR